MPELQDVMLLLLLLGLVFPLLPEALICQWPVGMTAPSIISLFQTGSP